jgi:hypothetical protein
VKRIRPEFAAAYSRDRDANCGAAMEPVAISTRRNGEWTLVHRCRACRALHQNRIAGDD